MDRAGTGGREAGWVARALPVPPRWLGLAHGEVHVWWLDLDIAEPAVGEHLDVLDPEERGRADRLLFKRDQHRFVVAHGLVRGLLGAYLSVPPGVISYGRAARGKPFLVAGGPAGDTDIRFNVSASGGTALLAVARACEVGIDVQRIDGDRDALGIAERFFSPAERASLRALPVDQQVAAFYRVWARKEAYVKARGDGLSLPLDSFDVPVSPQERAAVLRSSLGPSECQRWTMLDVPTIDGFAAALVVESSAVSLRTFRGVLTVAGRGVSANWG